MASNRAISTEKSIRFSSLAAVGPETIHSRPELNPAACRHLHQRHLTFIGTSILSWLSVISRNSPKRLGMVPRNSSPEFLNRGSREESPRCRCRPPVLDGGGAVSAQAVIGPHRGLCFGRRKGHPAQPSRLTLGPGFWRLKIRPRFCSSDARNASSPSGRPVCSWARRSFRSSSLITLVRNRRQSGTSWSKGLTRTSVSSRPRTCARALLQG